MQINRQEVAMKTLIKLLIILSFFTVSCSHVQTLEESVEKPVLLEKPKLIYPNYAQQNNISGKTKVLFTISEEGKVTQTLVKKSSGSAVLDKAAENYCRGMVFTPAKKGGIPIEFGMTLEIKFDFKDFNNFISNKIADTQSLYSKAENSVGKSREDAQAKILQMYQDIIKEVSDCGKFNEYVYSVISKDVQKGWESEARSCPLSFLLYHDFIERFDDYINMDSVLHMLKNSIKQDLYFISVTESKEISHNRIGLIKKIKQFVEKNYPDFEIEYPATEIELKSNIS